VKHPGSCHCKGRNFGTKRINRFSIDHDHQTGSIRGLLCTQCNVLIGHARESAENIKSAINYLREHQDKDPHRQRLRIF